MNRSDLRAELDQLPQPSQLMYCEPRIMFPPRLVGVPDGRNQIVQLPHDPPLNADDVLDSYTFQVQLRLTLNRTHTALYSTHTRMYKRLLGGMSQILIHSRRGTTQRQEAHDRSLD